MTTYYAATTSAGQTAVRSTKRATYSHAVVYVGTQSDVDQAQYEVDERKVACTDEVRAQYAEVTAELEALKAAKRNWLAENPAPEWNVGGHEYRAWQEQQEPLDRPTFPLYGELDRSPVRRLERATDCLATAQTRLGQVFDSSWHSRHDLAHKARGEGAGQIVEAVETDSKTFRTETKALRVRRGLVSG